MDMMNNMLMDDEDLELVTGGTEENTHIAVEESDGRIHIHPEDPDWRKYCPNCGADRTGELFHRCREFPLPFPVGCG